MSDFKELSRKTFKADTNSMEFIQTGCLQRIADATEAMSQNYIEMQRELKWYKERYKESQ